MKFVSIDIETTGLDPERHQILEFGAVIADTVADEPEGGWPTFRRVLSWGTIEGQPKALAMNAKLLEEIAEDGDDVISYAELETEFGWWLNKNGGYAASSYGAINAQLTKINSRLVVAGKNFDSFDRRFIERVFDDGIVEFSRRSLDPAILFLKHDDEVPPGLSECMKRAGMEGTVPHTAVEDALIVVNLIRRGMRIYEL